MHSNLWLTWNSLVRHTVIEKLGFTIYARAVSLPRIIEECCGPTCLPVVIILGLGLLLFCCSHNQLSWRNFEHGLESPLQALLTVFTPTRSNWPPAYFDLAYRAKKAGSNVIYIPLRQFLRDVAAGIIELRDPRRDFCDLFGDELRVYGWVIRFQVGYSDWIFLMCWMLDSIFRALLTMLSDPQVKPPISFKNHPSPGTEPDLAGLDIRVTPIPARYSDGRRVLQLDYLPFNYLENAIRTLQSTMSPGDSCTLEFSTLSPSVKWFNVKFVLCAIPFLPRRHIIARNVAYKRTPAVLMMSLQRVIELATSGSSPLTITGVHNVSGSCAALFDSIVDDLEGDRQTRKLFVDRWGADCWREHKLMSTWESGLLKMGSLMRWIVVLRR